EAGDLVVQVPAEGVVTGGRDDGGVETVLGGGDGDVRGRTAEVLAEGLDLLEADAVLERVDVDADASDRDQVERRGSRCRGRRGGHGGHPSLRRRCRGGIVRTKYLLGQ